MRKTYAVCCSLVAVTIPKASLRGCMAVLSVSCRTVVLSVRFEKRACRCIIQDRARRGQSCCSPPASAPARTPTHTLLHTHCCARTLARTHSHPRSVSITDTGRDALEWTSRAATNTQTPIYFVSPTLILTHHART